MNLRSDNEAPACEELLAAVIAANAGGANAYGDDPWTNKLESVYSEFFETEVKVFPITTGTAANVSSLSHACPPWGAVFCHHESHVQVDECGAFEFYSGGAKLFPLPGDHGRISPDALQQQLQTMGLKGDHGPLPAGLTLTQATECGTIYSTDQVAELCEIAHQFNMTTHLDGARFANAAASLGQTPADLTWRAGIDMMSFAASKNGGLLGEAVVFFKPELAEQFGRRRMKGGHLASKMRYISAQLLAYVEDDLWLRLAGQANAAATRISQALENHPGATLEHPVQANEVFVHLDSELDNQLREAGYRYHPWPGVPGLFRMVCGYHIEEPELQRFETLINAL
jgi:threonine aldolase